MRRLIFFRRSISASICLSSNSEFSALFGEETKSHVGPGCSVDPFFAAEVWDKIGVQTCLKCHKVAGDAEDSNFVLRDPQRSRGAYQAESMQHNQLAFEKMARLKEDDQPRLLLKVVGKLEHGGKEVLKLDSTEYRVLADFVRRVTGFTFATPQVVDENAAPFFDGVVMLDDRMLLRRITLSLAGRLPKDKELAACSVGSSSVGQISNPAERFEKPSLGEVFSPLLDSIMTEGAFYDRLREAFEDIFLTAGIEETDAVTASGLTYEHFGKTRLWYQKHDLGQFTDKKEEDKARRKLTQDHHKAMLDKPMRFIVYIVRNNLPFTEIVTADYIMVTPLTSRAYGVFDEVKTQFKNPDDPFEYLPVTLKAGAPVPPFVFVHRPMPVGLGRKHTRLD